MLAILAVTVATALSIEDVVTMPVPSSPQWSPDGTRIAYVVTRADLKRSVYEGDIHVLDAASREDKQLTRDGNDTAPRWSPDGKQLAFLSDRGGPAQIYVIDVAGGEAKRLTNEPTAIRLFEWSDDGTRIAFTRTDEPTAEEQQRARDRSDAREFGTERKHQHLHVLDVAGGEVKRLTSGAFSVLALSWINDEIAISRATGAGLDDLYRTDIYAVSSKDGSMRAIVARPGWDHGPVVSPDKKWIAFTSTGAASTGDARDWLREHDLAIVPVEGGTPRALATTYDRTPESHTWSGNTIWFDGPLNMKSPIFSVTETSFTKQLDGVHADVDVHGNRIATICQSLTQPLELCIDGTPVTHHNDSMRTRLLGETRVIRWKSAGLEIEGLLTLPAGYKPGERVPLITFVHGGPASHFSESFLGYLATVYLPHQLYAGRGFAVLRPNPRGSGGYGSAFRRGPLNDWMNLPWRDVEAGIDNLVADGIADPKRLGLAGWSYGGYLASSALARTERFGAVSMGGAVVDLFSDHLTSDIRDYIPAYFPGVPLEQLRAQSPLWQLKKTNANVLLFHGENDERVPIAQSVMLYHRLRELGANVSFIVLPRSAHTPREPKLRMEVVRRNLEFFEKYVR